MFPFFISKKCAFVSYLTHFDICNSHNHSRSANSNRRPILFRFALGGKRDSFSGILQRRFFFTNGSGLYSHRGKKLERRSASFPGKFFIRRKGNSQQRAFQQRSGIPFGKRRNRKQAQSDFHVGRRRAFRSQIFSFSL